MQTKNCIQISKFSFIGNSTLRSLPQWEHPGVDRLSEAYIGITPIHWPMARDTAPTSYMFDIDPRSLRAVVQSTFVESKTSPSPKRFESESRPSPKRFESESSPSPKRVESKSSPSPNETVQNRERKKIFFKTTYLIIDN